MKMVIRRGVIIGTEVIHNPKAKTETTFPKKEVNMFYLLKLISETEAPKIFTVQVNNTEKPIDSLFRVLQKDSSPMILNKRARLLYLGDKVIAVGNEKVDVWFYLENENILPLNKIKEKLRRFENIETK